MIESQHLQNDTKDSITPEQLKLLAEYMGYEPYSIPRDAFVYYDKFNSNGENRYNPLENSDQCLELICKLASVGVIELDASLHCKPMVTYDSVDYYGKTINEAVTLAAIAYVESVKESE